MADSKVHPIDVSTLNKGDVISVEQVEEIVGMKRDDPAFWHAKLELRSFIMKASAEAGRPLLLREDQQALRVMLDNEASQWTHGQMLQGQQRIVTNLGRRELVNVAALTEAERSEHDRVSCNWGAKTAALVSAGQSPRRVAGGTPPQLPEATGKNTEV